jgi:hypothetical protein
MAKLNVATCDKHQPLKFGSTVLSVKSANGSIFLVDEKGEMIQGLISVTAETSVADGTIITAKFYSHNGAE